MGQFVQSDNIYVGDYRKSHKGLQFEVMEIEGEVKSCRPKGEKLVKIKFTNTGYESWVKSKTITSGKVRDPYEPHIFGVGYKGEGKYRARRSVENGSKVYKSYEVWIDMLWRVYGDHKLSNRYKERGVSVCEEWHNFQNFAEWYLTYKPENRNLVLDKDILVRGNKKYSPMTCTFVPQEVNKFFCASNKRRGDLPVGVYFHERFNKYEGCVSHRGSKHIKYFNTSDEAFAWYKHKKEGLLQTLADIHFMLSNIDSKAHDALLRWRAVPYPD